jgi:hypothetical protein
LSEWDHHIVLTKIMCIFMLCLGAKVDKYYINVLNRLSEIVFIILKWAETELQLELERMEWANI